MRTIIKITSFAGLFLTLVPSFLVFTGIIELNTNKILMIIGTAMWFFTVPFWMNRKKPQG